SQMGFSFYTKSGLKRYIERYYSLPDDEISMKFAKDRMGYITDFRAENILKHRFHRLTGRPGDSSSQTDVQYPLLRPQSGFEEMFRVIERSLSEYGCAISKNEKIVSLKKQKNSYLVTTNKRSDEAFDLVLLAAPPQSIMDSFSVSNPCNSVESFSLLSLFLKGNVMINGDIFYNSSPYGKWKRMTVFNRLYDETSEFDRFTVEFVLDSNAPQTTIQEAFKDFVASSERLFILDSSTKLCGGVYTENAYPKLTIVQEQDIQCQQEFLTNSGIASIGRQGEYKYFTGNECVVSAVEKIQQAGGAKG
ncbi:MAG: hypothetical protein J7K88_07065, partial [Candidatus Fermentibacteraceae bacterium]|nr:hypothetical protein [Candidatus Fermentibacteraceae bacterium]